MQQSSKQWIIAISIILIAALFILFVPYGKDAAVYRMTKKYISSYYDRKPSSVVVKSGSVGVENDCVWLCLEIDGYSKWRWIDEDGSALIVSADYLFSRTDDFNIRKINRLLWLSYH